MREATTAGLVLAAGAGSRYGRPKALVVGAGVAGETDGAGEPWVARAVRALEAAGCAPVIVVLGAAAEAAERLVPTSAEILVAPDWQRGLSASLRAGLAALATTDARAAVVTLVDLPGVTPESFERLLSPPPDATTLRRAGYRGRPGHPVVIGREHWAAAAASATGDRGAGAYLKHAGAAVVDCTDLGGGDDVDEPTSGHRGG